MNELDSGLEKQINKFRLFLDQTFALLLEVLNLVFIKLFQRRV